MITLSPETLADFAAMLVLWTSLPAAVVVGTVQAWRQRDLAGQMLLAGRRTGLAGAVIAVTLSLFLSHPAAVDTTQSANRILIWICYVALFVLALHVERRRWIDGLLALSGAFVAATVLAGYASTSSRSAGVLGNPNVAGGVLAMVASMTPMSVMLFALFAALVATGSRGAILAVIVTLAWERIERRWMAVTVILVALGLLIAMRPSTVRKRMRTWTEAGRLFLERPITGWGGGSYPNLARNEPDHPHADSFILTVAAEQGLLGLAAWGWMAWEILRRAWRSDDPARWGLAAFCVQNMVDNLLWWYWPGIAAVLVAALSVRRQGC